ncbi:MAG: SusD/RagB family nutrient-binding outer membrane lipoprotein, partial [Cyclobacteriaceae bacterium]
MKLYKIFLLIFATLFCLSCSNEWLEINTDPNAATSVSGDQLFPGVLANIASNRSIETGPGQNFFVQAWAPNGSTGVFINPDRYVISPFTTGNTWGFLYRNALQNLKLAIDASMEAPIPAVNVIGQSKILQSMIYFDLTTYWGDIPFTQANNLEFPIPDFDTQETVMRGV